MRGMNDGTMWLCALRKGLELDEKRDGELCLTMIVVVITFPALPLRNPATIYHRPNHLLSLQPAR